MPQLDELPCWDDRGNLRIVVEAPQGSNAKLKYEPELGAFELQRFIQASGYPYDWGFVPSTLAEDGDPLDALVIHEGHTYPGVIIPSIAIGVLKLTETKDGATAAQRNDRLIAVPATQPAPFTLAELGAEKRQELERFFVATGRLAQKRVKIERWAGPTEAAQVLLQVTTAYAYAKGHRGGGQPSHSASVD